MKALLTSLLLLLSAAAAEARSLHWSEIAVEARLDADGVLHVSERQSMVFDGAWNGGERVFDTRPGQRLRLERISRIGDDGRRVELERGNLDQVDEWNWESRNVLRWRSRLPSDPPFDQRTLRYQIDYRLSGILSDSGSGYALDHDFAFRDRFGVIEVFTLDLELDPVWIAEESPRRLRLENLSPGRGALVVISLTHSGESRPAAVDHAVPTHQVQALAIALLSLLGLKLTALWRAETASGRRERPRVPRPISRQWLAENLFSLAPEEAGALWDRKVGAPEVAAVIARMVAEGKLSSRVADEGRWWRRPTMGLDLLVERSELVGYERKLIDKLFFGGRTTTDTRALQKHYKSTGFAPAEQIRPEIKSRLADLAGDEPKPAKPPWKPTVLLFVAWLGMVALEAVTRGSAALAPLVAALATAGVIPVGWAYIGAAIYRQRVGRPPLAWLAFLPPLVLLVGGCVFFAWGGSGGREVLTDLRPGLAGMLALLLYPLWIGVSVLNTAHTRESRGVIARRKLLAAAREHFADELRKETPDLEDSWFPYLLAFGLSREADTWGRTFGSDSAAGSQIGSTSWSGSSRAGAGWSGGGGAFGGAGATAAWTAAATGMAAGVSAPSSSGSGGGGGGSSGGGGGGGW